MNISKCLRMLATESSIHTLRISAITVSDRVVYADTSSFDKTQDDPERNRTGQIKNEDTWCKALWHLICRIRYNSESTQGVVVWEALCTFVRNRDGNLNAPYLYYDGDKVVLNWNWLENDWNGNNPALRLANLFISPPSLSWGSFVYPEVVEWILKVCHSNRPNLYQIPQFLRKEKCIFGRQNFLSPK